MYCRSDPGRQRAPPSVTDVLTAVREESQQLEAELSGQQEVPRGTARPSGEQGTSRHGPWQPHAPF